MDPQFTALLGLGLLALLLSWFMAPLGWARLLLWLGRTGAGLRSRHAQVNGLGWHYLEGGHGPALIALHGFGADADHWLAVAHRLRRHFHIIAPDLIGFGTSDTGDELTFDIDSQVERLRGLLDGIGVETCVLAGNSMGGWIASAFAAKHPDRVTGLWLLAPLGVRDCETGELLDSIADGHDSPLDISSLKEFDQRVFRPMFAKPPPLPRPLRLYYGQHALRRSTAAKRMFAQVLEGTPALEETLGALDTPVLLQWGSMDRAVHVSGAERLRGVIKRGEVMIQPGIGHLPMLEAASLSTSQFLDFARRFRLPGFSAR
jgi:pimeloyl-ACP methyl ester carboxylesterase